MKTVGQPILAAASFQAAFRSRLKAGRSQDWLPHLFCLLLSGCAYVGEPLPPALNIPRRVPVLVAEQVGSRLTLQFELPLQTTETLPLQIESIELRAGPVDPGAWPAGAQPINTTRSVDGKTASASAELTPWVGKRIIAGVRVQSKQGKWSDWSPLAPLDVIQPLAPPADVKPRSRAGRRPVVMAPGVAMRIERRLANGTFTEAAMVEGAEWIDKQARFGEEQQYRLTAMSGKARSETSRRRGSPAGRVCARGAGRADRRRRTRIHRTQLGTPGRRRSRRFPRLSRHRYWRIRARRTSRAGRRSQF